MATTYPNWRFWLLAPAGGYRPVAPDGSEETTNLGHAFVERNLSGGLLFGRRICHDTHRTISLKGDLVEVARIVRNEEHGPIEVEPEKCWCGYEPIDMRVHLASAHGMRARH